MWEQSIYVLHEAFGGDLPDRPLALYQVAARAIVICVGGIVMVRLGKSRLISRTSAIDVLVAFLLGSLLSRGITGSASISGTLVACAVVIALHWLLTLIAFYDHRFGNLVKGHANPLIKDGVVIWENMRKSHISEHDLIEELRLNANLEDPKLVKAAYKERNGAVSVVLH